jgi:diguanylate cyclase (GGDEF)-like protein
VDRRSRAAAAPSGATEGLANCRELSLSERVAAQLRALLSDDTDQALVRARTSGEVLVGAMRLALIVAIVIANAIYYPEVMRSTLGLVLTLAAPLYAAGMLALAFKVQGAWIAWASCALDVTLISITLFLFVVTGEPLGAVNNKFLFETYSFVVINSILRFDWRLCAFSAALAFVQFLGITSYVAAHWDLATLQSPSFGVFNSATHTFRMIVLVGAGASCVAAAKWARHLRLMVGTDHLTGLSQRRPFLERIQEELERSGARTSLSVALFDVDEFKRYNDRFGHLEGDRALQLLAQRLRKLIRTTDLAARFGGEEFIVAFPRMDVARATRRVNELRLELAKTVLPTTNGPEHLTVSAGVGSWPEDGQSFEEVLARVDERLYEAKGAGRNRVVGPSKLLSVADG